MKRYYPKVIESKSDLESVILKFHKDKDFDIARVDTSHYKAALNCTRSLNRAIIRMGLDMEIGAITAHNKTYLIRENIYAD